MKREHYQNKPIVGFTIDPADCQVRDDGLACTLIDHDHALFHVSITNATKHISADSKVFQQVKEQVASDYRNKTVKHMLPKHLLSKLSLDQHKTRNAIFVTWEAKRTNGDWQTVDTTIWEGRFSSLQALSYKHGNQLLQTGRLGGLQGLTRTDVCHLKLQAALLQEFFLSESQRHGCSAAKNLIHNAAVQANKAISSYLDDHDSSQLYRNHAGVYVTFSNNTLQLVSDCQAYSLKRPLVSKSFCASYGTECKGHHGLRAKKYTHATSPLRRFPDMIMHYILRARLHGKTCKFDDPAVLKQHADHCNTVLQKQKQEDLHATAQELISELQKFVADRDKLSRCPEDEFSLLVGAYADLSREQRESTLAQAVYHQIVQRITANRLQDVDYCTLLFVSKNSPSLIQLALKGIKKNDRQRNVCDYLTHKFLPNVKSASISVEQNQKDEYVGRLRLEYNDGSMQELRSEPTRSFTRARRSASEKGIKKLLRKEEAA